MTKTRLHLIIEGKVQGVFFRAFVRDKAKALGVKGRVKNINDGVEVVAEGERADLEKILAECKKGPIMAKVENVKEEWSDCKEEFDRFEIHY